MLPFPDVVHLFPDEFAGLGRRGLAFACILPGAFESLLLWHLDLHDDENDGGTVAAHIPTGDDVTRASAHAGSHRHRHSDRIIAAIAIFKFVKVVALVGLGLGALQMIRSDWAEQARALFDTLGQSVDVIPVLHLLHTIGALPPDRLRLLGVGAFVYAALFLAEGTGLWLEKVWAEYFTVIATASFIPFEVYELVKRVTWPRGIALVINIGVLVYLIWRLRHPMGAGRTTS